LENYRFISMSLNCH